MEPRMSQSDATAAMEGKYGHRWIEDSDRNFEWLALWAPNSVAGAQDFLDTFDKSIADQYAAGPSAAAVAEHNAKYQQARIEEIKFELLKQREEWHQIATTEMRRAEDALDRVALLEFAIRKHRDYRGDDRCHLAI